MVALFLLRLCFGLLGSLLLLLNFEINARFYRVQFLTGLGLLTGAFCFPLQSEPDTSFYRILGACVALTILGSMSWTIEGFPLGKTFTVLGSLLSASLLILEGWYRTESGRFVGVADNLTSAAVIGLATSAMLLGHSYLIAPMMSIRPLQRLVTALGVALLLRLALAFYALMLWRQDPAFAADTDTVVWLVARWVTGFVMPLILSWMAWETTRIRSTQSATGILYVVVIFCFLGELTSQLLSNNTNLPL